MKPVPATPEEEVLVPMCSVHLLFGEDLANGRQRKIG